MTNFFFNKSDTKTWPDKIENLADTIRKANKEGKNLIIMIREVEDEEFKQLEEIYE